MISVIIPIFNSKNTLVRCIKSLTSQTYSSFEAILIDDGSNDGSAELCDEYSSSDPRFHVIHQKNSGVSDARNVGLKASKGEYIAFIDSDDYVEPTYFYKLLQSIIIHHADIVYCPAIDENPDGSPIQIGGGTGSQEILSENFDWYGTTQHSVVWGALYKKVVLDGLSFYSNFYVGEDSLFWAQAVKQSSKLYYLDKPLYHYVIYTESAVHGSFNEKKLTELYAWKKICDVWNGNNRVRAAYAVRCKGFCEKYYKDDNFKFNYLNSVINEYRINESALIAEYKNRRQSKSAISAWLFGIAPKLYLETKKIKKRE